jgi:hypothetical protein
LVGQESLAVLERYFAFIETCSWYQLLLKKLKPTKGM